MVGAARAHAARGRRAATPTRAGAPDPGMAKARGYTGRAKQPDEGWEHDPTERAMGAAKRFGDGVQKVHKRLPPKIVRASGKYVIKVAERWPASRRRRAWDKRSK